MANGAGGVGGSMGAGSGGGTSGGMGSETGGGMGCDGGDSDGDNPTAAPVGPYLVYFAAERTLLAWIRAALGLMALGFVIDRFGLVVRTMTAAHADRVVQSPTMSFLAGAGLIALGALMAAVAAVRYRGFLRRYRESGDIDPGRGLEPAIAFTVAVGLAAALIAGYLMAVPP